MNHIELKFSANLKNESFARVAVSSFASELDPTIDELIEIKTIISEAVSNAIIHGYKMDESRDVYVRAKIINRALEIEVIDYGCGIENIDEILSNSYSIDCDNEHSGMGITIMKSLSNDFKIHSMKDLGTRIVVKKEIAVNTIKDESKAV
jgi:stage II sporulation protein AB (anti-sigma F factor)